MGDCALYKSLPLTLRRRARQPLSVFEFLNPVLVA